MFIRCPSFEYNLIAVYPFFRIWICYFTCLCYVAYIIRYIYIAYQPSLVRAPYSEYELLLEEDGGPYLERTYDGQTISGYRYSVILSPDAYRIEAAPEECGSTGQHVFTMQGPDGLVQKEPCR